MPPSRELRVLYVIDHDIQGDISIVPHEEEGRVMFNWMQRKDAMKIFDFDLPDFDSFDHPDRLFPRRKELNHSFSDEEYKILTKLVDDLADARDGYPFYPIPTWLAVHYRVERDSQEAGSPITFVYTYHDLAIQAFRLNSPPIKCKFDLVILPLASDLISYGLSQEEVDSLPEEIKRPLRPTDLQAFYAYIENHVGHVPFGPYKDVLESNELKDTFYTRQVYLPFTNQDMFFPTGVVVAGQPLQAPPGANRYKRANRRQTTTRENAFKWDGSSLALKKTLSYGASTFEGNYKVGDAYPGQLDRSIIVQPLIEKLETAEIKVVLPKGTATQKKEERVALPRSGHDVTYLESSDEFFTYDNKGGIKTATDARAAEMRNRLFTFAKEALQRLLNEAPNRGCIGYQSGRNWARVDVAWNGETNENCMFIVNEFTAFNGAWTYNNPHVNVVDLNHIVRTGEWQEPTDIQPFLTFIENSAIGLLQLLRGAFQYSQQHAQQPVRKAVQQFRQRLLWGR